MLGPLFRLELVTTARPPWVLALRAGYVSVLAWTLWASYERLSDQGDVVTLQAVSRFAGAFFSNFAWLQLLVVVGLGPALVASAIAGDRERAILDHLAADVQFAYDVKRGHGIDGAHDGIVYKNLLASYTHLRSTGDCDWPSRFVDFARRCKMLGCFQESPRCSE